MREETEQRIKVYKNFIATFDSYKFKRRAVAQRTLDSLLKSVGIIAQQCRDSVKADYVKFKEKYITDKESAEKYDYAVNAQQQLCKNEEQVIMALDTQVQTKFYDIGDLEANINIILANKYGSKYHVVTDRDMNWGKFDFKNFVIPARKKFEYYPYIVKGDFNGDGISDLAAQVKDIENNRIILMAIWGDMSITFIDKQLGSGLAISYFSPNKLESHWEQSSITLKYDAIGVELYEASFYVLYWNGKSFQSYQLTD
jgi:hypothetical protein